MMSDTGVGIPTTALGASFTRKGLRCNRMVFDYPDRPEMGHQVIWIVGGPQGCITLNLDRRSAGGPRLLPHPFELRINGEYWLPIVVARHTLVPIDDYDVECGPCMYLDGLPCYGDSSGTFAVSIMEEAIKRNSEEFIWDVLIETYHDWIVKGGETDAGDSQQ